MPTVRIKEKTLVKLINIAPLRTKNLIKIYNDSIIKLDGTQKESLGFNKNQVTPSNDEYKFTALEKKLTKSSEEKRKKIVSFLNSLLPENFQKKTEESSIETSLGLVYEILLRFVTVALSKEENTKRKSICIIDAMELFIKNLLDNSHLIFDFQDAKNTLTKRFPEWIEYLRNATEQSTIVKDCIPTSNALIMTATYFFPCSGIQKKEDELKLCIKQGRKDRVKHLIETEGVCINGRGTGNSLCAIAQRLYDGTPLIIAVRFGQIKICKYLLTQGAEVNITDNWGNTAIDYAKKSKDKDIIVGLLKNYFAKSANELIPEISTYVPEKERQQISCFNLGF